MKWNKNSMVGSIVQDDYRTADVFKKYKISFCCTGMMSLNDACEFKKLDLNDLLSELNQATRTVKLHRDIEYDQWDIDFLVDYITNLHHLQLKSTLPELRVLVVNYINGHEVKYPELIPVREVFSALAASLFDDLEYEEQVIFPYIKQLSHALKGKESYASLFVKTLRKPIQKMIVEHGNTIALLKELKAYTNNFAFPKEACTNYQVIFFKLSELYDDLIQHHFLEKEILYPKAIQLENELLQLAT